MKANTTQYSQLELNSTMKFVQNGLDLLSGKYRLCKVVNEAGHISFLINRHNQDGDWYNCETVDEVLIIKDLEALSKLDPFSIPR